MALIEVLRSAATGLIAVGALAFLDAPLRTFGQSWTVQRPRERTILLSLEIDLYALWAVAKFVLGWDRPLAPAGATDALAAFGAPVVLAGVGLAVWAKLKLGRWFSANFGVKRDHVLITDGPYALVRHPIYAGLIATLAGGALLWDSRLTLLLAALMALPLYFHTVFEELLFEQHFGAAYREYQARVPRLVPFGPQRRG